MNEVLPFPAYGLKARITLLVFLALVFTQPLVRAAWKDDVADTAERGAGGILKKVWVVKNGAEVYQERDLKSVTARLKQHAKAYHFGAFDDTLIAIGDKPTKKECAHHGYIRKKDVIIWDTDQALRFVGDQEENPVALFRDEAMSDQIGEASVEGPSDPTVMPFPIFRRSSDGRAFEIAFIYTAASGADTYDARLQESLRKVITKDITGIDIVFVMDVTGSMGNVLDMAKQKIRGLVDEFTSRKVTIFGQSRPLRLRFAFVGYRDELEGPNRWVEVVPFYYPGQMKGFENRLNSIKAMTRLNNDWAESVYGGIDKALDLRWRKENAKAIILVGDAAPKDRVKWPRVLNQCQQKYIRIYTIALESQAGTLNRVMDPFKKIAGATGGRAFAYGQANDKATVDSIIESLSIEEANIVKAPQVIMQWAEDGANLSRDVQEFVFRGVLPEADRRPIPPTVFVSSKQDNTRQVCLFKSRAGLYEMLGDMQTDFVGMIEDPSPELLAAINAGGVEVIAELDPNVIQSIVALDDFSKANEEIKKMLEAMPTLPGIIRELNDKGMAVEWHELARKTAALSRFVSDPQNFYEDHAWVPFEVLDYEAKK